MTDPRPGAILVYPCAVVKDFVMNGYKVTNWRWPGLIPARYDYMGRHNALPVA